MVFFFIGSHYEGDCLSYILSALFEREVVGNTDGMYLQGWGLESQCLCVRGYVCITLWGLYVPIM